MTNPFIGNDLRPENPDNPFRGNDLKEPPRQGPSLDAVMRGVSDFTPDQWAEARALSPRVGISTSAIVRNLDEVKRLAGDRAFNPGEFKRRYPEATRWMESWVENAAVAQDDTESLAGTERALGKGTGIVRFLNQFGNPVMSATRMDNALTRPNNVVIAGGVQRSLDRGIAVLDAGRVGTQRMLGDDSEESRVQADALRALMNERIPEMRGGWRFVAGTAEILPAMVPGIALGAVGAMAAGVALPALGAGAAVTAAGGTTAGFLGRYLSSFALEGGNAMLQFENLTDENGVKMNRETARAAAMTVGIYGGLLDAVSMGVVLKPFGNAYQAIAGRGLSQALRETTVRRVLGRGAMGWAAGMASEITTETAQQGISLAAEQAARLASNAGVGEPDVTRTQLNAGQERIFKLWYREQAEKAGLDPDPDSPLQMYDYRGAFVAGVEPEISDVDGLYHWPSQFKDAGHPNRFVGGEDTRAIDRGRTAFKSITRERVAEELAATAVQTFFGTALIAGFGSGTQVVTDLNRLAKSRADVDAIGELAGVAEGSKLRQRDPEKFREAVSAIVPEDKQTVAVDAERVVMLLQEQNVPLAQFAQMTGTTIEALTEAAQRGGDALLQTASVMANLTGTPVMEFIQPELKSGPNGLSAREIKEQEAAFDKDVKTLRTQMEAMAEDGPKTEEGTAVYNEVRALLASSAVGVEKQGQLTPENLDAQAKVIAAFYEVMGERTKLGAEALFRSRNYRVLAPAQATPLYQAVKRQQTLERQGKTNTPEYADLTRQIAEMEQSPVMETTQTLLQEGVETIEVDGVQRPTLNSEGRPIHPTEEGVRNFWRWATEGGKQPIADEQGRPVIAFRGDKDTVSDFTGRRRERGLFLAAEPERAGFYGANVQGLYMRASNVLDLRNPRQAYKDSQVVRDVLDTVFGDNYEGTDSPQTGEPVTMDEFFEQLEAGSLWSFESTGGFQMSAWRDLQEFVFRNGFDAFIAFDTGEGVGRGVDYILDDGEQVKSATGNSGAFGPSANILEQAIPLTPLEREAVVASELRELRDTFGATAQESAREFGLTVADVERMLTTEYPEVTQEMIVKSAFLEQAAFHGSPYVFDKFSLSAIGTGEGAQAYGWGLYFAESEKVANEYQKTLTRNLPVSAQDAVQDILGTSITEDEYAAVVRASTSASDLRTAAVNLWNSGFPKFKLTQGWFEESQPTLERIIAAVKERNQGALYRVDIPDAAVAKFLDWDKPLSEQSPAVRKFVKQLGSVLSFTEADGTERAYYLKKDASKIVGAGFYDALSRQFRSQEAASKALLAAGIPGIKYLDAGSRVSARDIWNKLWDGAKHSARNTKTNAMSPEFDTLQELNRWIENQEDGTRNLVVFDEDLVTITHRNGEPLTAQERADFLEQGVQRQGANAFIRPLPSQKIIGLLKTANPTSVLHEFAHDWLNILTEYGSQESAPQALKDDLAVVLKWLKVDDPSKIGVKEQETFARGAERYFATADAPSVGLARAFARFRGFFSRIYRQVKAMLVPLDPEVQNVFDRMLASDDAIREARAEVGAEPMFTPEDAEALGKTAQEMADYMVAVQTSNAASSAALLKRIMAETLDENIKARAERKKAITAEVTEAVDAEPIYQARAQLKTAPLNKALVVEAFGPDVVRTIGKDNVAKDATGTPDEYALAFGYRDGTAFIEALQQAPSRAREIAARVRAQMNEEFPDPVQRFEVMKLEADKAAHMSETDKVLLDELKALAKVNGIVPPSVEAVRAVARETIAKVQIKDLSVVSYRNAERKAATEAGKAWRSGDRVAAEQFKRKQLINHILVREAQAALDKAEVAKKFATRMAGESAQVRLGKAGKVYADAMGSVLDAYEFRTLSRPQMAAQESERSRALALQADIAAWQEAVRTESSVETEDGTIPLIDPVVPPDVLSLPMNYRFLTVERLQEVYDTMKQVYHIATTIDKEMRADSKMRFSERVELLLATAEKNWKPDAPQFIQDQSYWMKKMDKVGEAHGEMVKVEMLARLLDGDVPNGPWQQALTNYAAESQAEFNRDMEAFMARYTAAMDRISKERIKGFFTELVNVPGVAGVGTKNPRMTGQQVFHLLLNYGNESSRAAVNAGEYAGFTPYTDANAKALMALLTAEEMQAAQEIWDAVSMFWDQIAELNRQMTGLTPAKVKATPITLRSVDGKEVTLKGGYFPLKYSTRHSSKALQQEVAIAEQLAAGLTPHIGASSTTTQQGHLVSRQDANGRIVDLSADVVARHMTASVYDLTHRRMVYDVQKLVMDKRIADIVERTAGAGVYRHGLLPWARRLAGEKAPPKPWAAKLGLQARAGASTMGLGFRVTTMLLQYLGVGQVVSLLGPKYMVRGFQEIRRYGKGAFAAADALAPEVAFRQLSFNRDLTEMARNMKAKGTWTDAYEVAFAGIAFMDRQVSVAAFWGGYYQWLDSNPTDVAGATRAGEQAIRLSQGASGAKDLAAIMASNDPLTRVLTSFFSNGSVLYNLFWRGTRQAKQGTRAGRIKFLTTILGAWMVPAVLEPLMRGQGPDDDDDLSAQVEWWVGQIAGYPTQAAPIVRDVARMWSQGEKSFTTDFAPPFLRPFTAIGEAGFALFDAVAPDEEFDAKDVKALIQAIGFWGNLPLDAPYGMGERLYLWMTGEVQPDNVIEGLQYVGMNRKPR